jgi:hypothetical protein
MIEPRAYRRALVCEIEGSAGADPTQYVQLIRPLRYPPKENKQDRRSSIVRDLWQTQALFGKVGPDTALSRSLQNSGVEKQLYRFSKGNPGTRSSCLQSG